MSKKVERVYDLKELQAERMALLDRIQRLERDLKLPLEQDSSEQAGQLSNRIILSRLLEVERSNLQSLDQEISKAAAHQG